MITRTKKTKASRLGQFHLDTFLLTVCVSLLLIGYVMVTSSSIHIGTKQLDNMWNYPLKQLIHIGLGVVMGSTIATIPMRKWEKLGPVLFLSGLALLVIVMIPGLGIKVNGSTRWLSLLGLRIQVSEVVKFFAVIYMAGYITRHRESIRNIGVALFKPLALFVIASILLLMEPDFGSAVVILMIAMGTMYLAGAKLGQFILLFAGLAGMAAMLVIFEPYRMMRITSFLNPWADPLNSGFQLVQALISFGRGELIGVGLGSGIQKLSYLPEAHTDFLFSVIAEELGFLGVISVIGLFALFLTRAFQIGAKAEAMGEDFSAYIAYGLAIWFGFQAFVNMGVNMGMLPTKGLTLPLMSYGGGSMMIMCCALGLLFRVHSESAEINANSLPTPRVKAKARITHD